MKLFYCLLIILLLPSGKSFAQDVKTFELSGVVQSANGEIIGNARIYSRESGNVAFSSPQGVFSMKLPQVFPVEIEISAVEWQTKIIVINKMPEERLLIQLEPISKTLETVEITGSRATSPHVQRIDPNFTRQLPSASGHNIEGLVRSQMGVTSNSELSSQYSVRGGSFDENLVYVNGQEVYRPFLVHSGQQEGLSFVNPDMVENVEFSAGGFSAGYGDKMSSVLDIRYKQPKETAGSASAGLMGANAHLEGSALNEKLTWIAGARYKTSKYLLGTLDEKGEYQPDFTDIQTYLTYTPAPRLSFELLAYYSVNKYLFIPKERETTFGTSSETKQLTIYSDGKENNKFQTAYGAFSTNFKASANNNYKLTLTGFRTFEEESHDIISQYRLRDIDESGISSDEKMHTNLDTASSIRHARNDLFGTVASANFEATHNTTIGTINWGGIYQYENFKGNIHEYALIDSADYSIPRPINRLELSYFKHASHIIENHRVSGYLKNTTSFKVHEGNMIIDAGIRSSYSSFNEELIFSPRVLLTYLPANDKNYRIRLSGGYYYQPPFMKEYRKPDGSINRNLKSQKSIHVISGVDYYFSAFERPFKFTTEAYYKKLDNLIPYHVDNVRVIYSGENQATGYAAGIDFKLNGELVAGEESWITLSLMKTAEDLWNDVYLKSSAQGEPGYIPRPSDQLLNISVFLQDNLPSYPNVKAHLSFFFGTGLPFGPPDSPRYMGTLRYPAYKRLDFGMSYDLLSINSIANGFGRYLKNMWLGVELLNLPDIANTISYSWVTDVNGQENAVPNYLTKRRVNFKLAVKF